MGLGRVDDRAGLGVGAGAALTVKFVRRGFRGRTGLDESPSLRPFAFSFSFSFARSLSFSVDELFWVFSVFSVLAVLPVLAVTRPLEGPLALALSRSRSRSSGLSLLTVGNVGAGGLHLFFPFA